MNAVSFFKSPTNTANEVQAGSISSQAPTTMLNPNEMHAIFSMCRKNQWSSVLRCVQTNPQIPVTSMIMDNHISTTILHQAITSKGNTEHRAKVIRTILEMAPQAASIKNGYGSLPLHVIAQRNTKMDAPTKELLITELVLAYKGALLQPGGVGKRTPLHIIFTDYISPRVTELMIQYGPQACFMRDKKGYLPAHVACSRHCSPEKLRMLLAVNPESLMAKTNDGQTLLSLAIGTATKSHPNYALIDALRTKLDGIGVGMSVPRGISVSPRRAGATRSSKSKNNSKHQRSWKKALPTTRRRAASTSMVWNSSSAGPSLDTSSFMVPTASASGIPMVPATASFVDYDTTDSKPESNPRKVTDKSSTEEEEGKEAASSLMEDPVALLLHFSRHTDVGKGASCVAQV